MLRCALSRLSTRRLCTAAPQNPLIQAAISTRKTLFEADWVDTDDRLERLAERADGVINSYRAQYSEETANTTEKDVYDAMHLLHTAKEAARVCDAYGEHVEVLIRNHEDMTGSLGNTTEMPKGGADVTVKVLEDYVSFVNSLDDEEVRRKVEEELGRKMVVLKMVLSVPNFAGTIAPVASDRIVTDTKPTS